MITVFSDRRLRVWPLVVAMSLSPLAAADEKSAPSAPDEAPQLTEHGDKNKKAKDEKSKDGKDEKVAEGWHREGFSLRKGKNRIDLTGYAQADFRDFSWEVQGDELAEERSEGREIRRSRFGLQGEFGKVSFEVAYDPREAEEGSHLKDATLGYQFSKKFGILVGHFKPPISQEFLTSAAKTDFVERAMLTNVAPDRDWGAAVSGEVGRAEYAAGVFEGDGDGGGNIQRAETSAAARLSVKIVKGLSVAAAYMHSTTKPAARVAGGTSEPPAEGASGTALSGFTFWNRAHVKGTRNRIGTDLVYLRGPFRIRAEFLQAQDQREGQGSTGQDIPDIRARGWTLGGSYVLTGEKKGSTVEPKKSIFQGGMGALEVVARIEGLKFDDTGDPSGFAGYGNRARNIAPSGAKAIEAGLNYWPSNFMKFQGSALWESYNDPLIAPQPGKTGKYFTLLARIQLMVP